MTMTMTATATETMLVRHLNDWEWKTLPESLRLPFPKIDPAWCWVVDSPNGVVASAYGADLHGMAHMITLKTLDIAPSGVLVLLLRGIRDDLLTRGYTKVMCWLSATRTPEMKLARVFQRLGGSLAAESGWFAVASLEGRKW